MKTKKTILIIFLFFTVCFSLSARIEKNMSYLGTHFSTVQMIGGEENSQLKGWWGLDFGYYFSKRLGFEFTSSMGWSRPAEDGIKRYITYLYPVNANLRFNFVTDKKLIPYALLGVGMLYWDVRDITSDTNDYMFWERRGTQLHGAMQRDGIINFGAGINYFLSNSFALDLSARYHMIVEHGIDMSGCGDEHSAIWEMRLGLNYFFGAKKDKDRDGIRDKYDLCPNTPKGITVDKDGCPVDSDKDGVPDYKDECSDTPKGIRVDSKGCPVDSDNDGVKDDKDKCPNTPKNVKVNADGCPVDSDKDGIPDYLDKCPNTPKGIKVDGKGCPLDTDRDGVPDYKDKCPDTPKGTKVDEFGCEIKDIIKFQEKEPIILDDITFPSGKSILSDKAKVTLLKVLKTLKSYPDMKLNIHGYTDSTGPFDYNVMLSKKRAEAVRNFLINNGIDEKRLTAKGFGPKDPIAPNNTKAGRAKNRRIEFIQVK